MNIVGWSREFLLKHRNQFTKYFTTGVSGFILDMFTLFCFKEFLHIKPVVAIIFNQFISLAFIFFVNKYWTFKSKGLTHQQLTRFGVLCATNYAIAIIWMWVLNEKYGFNYLIVRTANVALSVSWNFFLYKYWVYRFNDSFVDQIKPVNS